VKNPNSTVGSVGSVGNEKPRIT